MRMWWLTAYRLQFDRMRLRALHSIWQQRACLLLLVSSSVRCEANPCGEGAIEASAEEYGGGRDAAENEVRRRCFSLPHRQYEFRRSELHRNFFDILLRPLHQRAYPRRRAPTQARVSPNMANSTALSRAFRSVASSACAACRRQPLRPFSHSTRSLAGPPDLPKTKIDTLLGNVDANFQRGAQLNGIIPAMSNSASQEWEEDDRHKFHIYATKHNTHITLAKPNNDSLISVSCGNIGFRKAGRGSYDAAYQLAAFVMSRIQDKGLLPQITKLELIYRGFGPGREAVTKAILGSEGKRIRPLITKLGDSTRLKFGGVRSKKPRRLG